MRKYFKFVDPNNSDGLILNKEGLNELTNNKEIHFVSKDAFAFIREGEDVYEVIPISKVYKIKISGEPKKYKAQSVQLKYIGKTYDVNTIKYMIENNVKISSNNYVVFRWAAGKGYFEIVKFLIEYVFNLSNKPKYGGIIGKFLLFIDDLLGSTYLYCLNNAFYVAARSGYIDIVKYLFERGADIHFNDDAALRFASLNGRLEVVKYLVEHGADIHAKGGLPIVWAASNGHFDVVKYLIEKGADVHVENDLALRWASNNGHFETVKVLVEAGANIHANSDEAIFLAMKSKRFKIVKYLSRINKLKRIVNENET